MLRGDSLSLDELAETSKFGGKFVDEDRLFSGELECGHWEEMGMEIFYFIVIAIEK